MWDKSVVFITFILHFVQSQCSEGRNCGITSIEFQVLSHISENRLGLNGISIIILSLLSYITAGLPGHNRINVTFFLILSHISVNLTFIQFESPTNRNYFGHIALWKASSHLLFFIFCPYSTF